MIKNNKYGGFTLLEMLVVVLIIGILAGIALPQYEKSVKKAKLAQMDIAISTAKKNVQLYLDANGYPGEKEEVFFTGKDSIADIEMPGDCSESDICKTDIGDFQAACGNSGCDITIHNSLFDFGIAKDPSVSNEWFVTHIPAENIKDAKIICQWLKDRHYRAIDSKSACFDKDVNVPLEIIK